MVPINDRAAHNPLLTPIKPAAPALPLQSGTMDNAPATSPPTATGLNWTPQLHTGDARMDHTHEEFVVQLNQLLATPQDQQLPLYRAFLDHTIAHFAQEDRWMLATGFSEGNCHASHHATILETMHAVIAHFEGDDPDIITRLAQALVEWFPQHAASMDAGLALHLKQVGFDSQTETLAGASQLRPASMSGCGSLGCG
jgi:hemerythrin